MAGTWSPITSVFARFCAARDELTGEVTDIGMCFSNTMLSAI